VNELRAQEVGLVDSLLTRGYGDLSTILALLICERLCVDEVMRYELLQVIENESECFVQAPGALVTGKNESGSSQPGATPGIRCRTR